MKGLKVRPSTMSFVDRWGIVGESQMAKLQVPLPILLLQKQSPKPNNSLSSGQDAVPAGP